MTAVSILGAGESPGRRPRSSATAPFTPGAT